MDVNKWMVWSEIYVSHIKNTEKFGGFNICCANKCKYYISNT
ncbi:hypothetical protein MNV_760015 [Candidatus Methanoperedens nitroreducens]|uniref:Uncharacterized protein n=1 Tax=Candidatus Methanoperedens nitratireducens TaxID=1392998 RepID=A0A284VTJ5_9EURY|nr:hypothetical protein MNV_760015 [Candidatus Methanoperedens nitroreducens]